MKNIITLPLLGNVNIPLIVGLCCAVAGIIISVVALIIVLNRKKKNPKVVDTDWFLALGGKENIKEATAVGSRLNLSLVNKENIDREKLKELGVSSVLTMSNKVTLVIEGQAEKIAQVINNSL